MARYKHIDTSPRFIAVNLERQLLPGTFEHALNHLIDHELDLSSFDDRYQNDLTGASAYPPAMLLKIVLFAYSHETIYRHVLKDKKAGGRLYTHMRIMSKKVRKRYNGKDSRGVLAGIFKFLGGAGGTAGCPAQSSGGLRGFMRKVDWNAGLGCLSSPFSHGGNEFNLKLTTDSGSISFQ